MNTFLVSLVSVLYAGAGFAGCYDWQESGSDATPLVKICYDETCDVVRQNFVCSLPNEVWAGFDDGWRFTFRVEDGEETRIIQWEGTLLTTQQAANVTCEVLYGDAEGC
jgi:hypothetical protein